MARGLKFLHEGKADRSARMPCIPALELQTTCRRRAATIVYSTLLSGQIARMAARKLYYSFWNAERKGNQPEHFIQGPVT